MRVASILACCLFCSSVAAQAGHRNIFPLTFDLHEKRSVAIANMKSPHEPRLETLTAFHPEEQRPNRPKFEIAGKRLRMSLPF